MTNVRKHFFEYGGQRFFRDNAFRMELGTYGIKKDPVGPASEVEREGDIPRTHLAGEIDKYKSGPIEFESVNKADFSTEGKITVFGMTFGSGKKFTYEEARKARLKLLGFGISTGALKDILNKKANKVKTFLADHDKALSNKGRVVSFVWIVVEAELASKIEASGGTKFSAEIEGANIKIKGSGSASTSRSETITLPPGSTFAYLTCKVKKWKNKPEEIDSMVEDEHGMK